MMTVCPICGTRRVIYWPQHWVYRRGETFYCSEDCMMVDETKDMKLIKMIAHVRAKGANRMRYKKDGTPAKKPGPKKNEIVISAADVGAIIGVEEPKKTGLLEVIALRSKVLKSARFEAFGEDRRGAMKLAFDPVVDNELLLKRESWIQLTEEIKTALDQLGVEE